MPRPLIGVCAAVERATFGVWKDEPATLLPLSYSRAIHGAGGMVALLPPDRRASEDPGELLDRLDALILGGGADIDPESQGMEPHPETVGTNPDRDRFEIALALAALERGMPLLGVCRGMQVLNVACGGTLDQHIPERLGHDRHRPVPGTWAEHEVRIEPGSLAATAAGSDRLTVKSHHHQGLDRIPDSLEPSAWAADDETIEAIEMRRDATAEAAGSPERVGDFVLGVLWHPEEDPQDRVIPTLVEVASS
ncbi:MAG TPA: gamma-glutamyl-gamma-aminobutyrate hydrolase family protein [Solirubrobacterales bacterium]|nr:gamma-glutamyl-gamma-aminobutyrate hydrolase family protein [Solirubrobacterales bacterium]